MHDWVVWCKSKKGAEEIRPFELSGKEIFANYDETKSKEEKNKKNPFCKRWSRRIAHQRDYTHVRMAYIDPVAPKRASQVEGF